MITIAGFWAGYRVDESTVSSIEQVPGVLAYWKQRLKAGEITCKSCGQIFIVTELCIDVMEYRKLLEMHSMKI